MKTLSRLAGLTVVTLLISFLNAQTTAPDPVVIAPDHYKVLLENDQVRVLDFRIKPREKIAPHFHPNYFVYALTPFRMRFSSPDGNYFDAEGHVGDTIWSDKLIHADENIGDSETHVLIVELKTPASN